MLRPTISILLALFCGATAVTQSELVIDTFAGNGNFGFSGDGGSALQAEISNAVGIAIDSDGNVYFVDYENERIRHVDGATGVITTVAGGGSIAFPNDGELATDILIHEPWAIAVTADGTLYFGDAGRVRRVDPSTGIVTSIAGGGTPTDFVIYPVAPWAQYAPNGVEGYGIAGGLGDGGLAIDACLGALGILTTNWGFNWGNAPIDDLAIDAAGNIFIAAALRVRRIDALTGIITTIAGSGIGQVAYTGPAQNPETVFSGVSSGDGGLATDAGLGHVSAIAIDDAGDLYISDREYSSPDDAGFDELNPPPFLFQFAAWQTRSRVRRVDAASGAITAFAGTGEFGYSGDGGSAVDATIGYVDGLAVDATGNVLIADTNAVVRHVDALSGMISTVVGNGTWGYGGDGGPVLLASVSPNRLAFDPQGNLYITEWDSARIRRVTGLSNAPPTADAGADQSIHAGVLVTLDGSASFDDNTPSAELSYAWTFVTRPGGSDAILYGADTASPSFTADLQGTYAVELVVADEGGLSSSPDPIEISSTNLAPAANAGADHGGVVNQTVHLDGAASSDPEMDPLTYFWILSNVPPGSAAILTGGDTSTPTFVPDADGAYVAALVVDDGFAPSAVDEVVITVITGEEFAEVTTLAAMETVAALPPASVTTAGNQKSLSQFLSLATQSIQNNNFSQARMRLQMAMERADGYTLRGALDVRGASRDWVTDEAQQRALYQELKAAFDALAP